MTKYRVFYVVDSKKSGRFEPATMALHQDKGICQVKDRENVPNKYKLNN